MRSSREHCGSRVAVGRGGRGGRRGGGRRGGGEEEDEKREEKEEDEDEEEATDIKSNNPHLAGGEKKVQTHGQGLGRGLAGDMGLNPLGFLFFFVFSWFFAVWPKPRENPKKTKKKVQTHGQGLGRGLAGDMGLNFLFFLFFHGFLQFGQNLEKTQKTKKSSDPWARSGERPGWGHGSELFVFFVFFVCPWFFAVWPKPRENPKKQKKKKFRPMGKVWGEAWLGTWV